MMISLHSGHRTVTEHGADARSDFLSVHSRLTAATWTACGCLLPVTPLCHASGRPNDMGGPRFVRADQALCWVSAAAGTLACNSGAAASLQGCRRTHVGRRPQGGLGATAH